jgi:hypothetical protein
MQRQPLQLEHSGSKAKSCNHDKRHTHAYETLHLGLWLLPLDSLPTAPAHLHAIRTPLKLTAMHVTTT